MPASAELEAFGVHWALGLFVEAVEEYAIFSLDRSGAVQTWNLGAHRIKGYHEHEILGRHFSVFYLAEDRRAGMANDALMHASIHGHWSGQGWRVRKDGTRFWANVVITAVFDRDGELEGFIKVTRDETDRRIAEERTRELDVLIERERIATALSETMVRDIFSATLALDGALSMSPTPRIASRIRDAQAILDGTLKQIRTLVIGPDAHAGEGRGAPFPDPS